MLKKVLFVGEKQSFDIFLSLSLSIKVDLFLKTFYWW
jgi:hypothetical protein